MNIQVYGISGYAGAGKDTFCKALTNTIKQKEDIPVMRCAFADLLKKNINLFLTRSFDISAFTKDHDEKEFIRPLLVCYGETMRNADPDYWVDKVFDLINVYKTNLLGTEKEMAFIIPDVRYENESRAVKDNGGILIHLDADSIEAPNESELENTPIVKDMADYIVKWPRFDSSEVEQRRQDIYEDLYSNILTQALH